MGRKGMTRRMEMTKEGKNMSSGRTREVVRSMREKMGIKFRRGGGS